MKTIPVSLVAAAMLLPDPSFAQAQQAPESGDDEAMRGKWKHQMAERMMKADADGDGFISKVEFDAMPRIQRIPAEKRQGIFERLDKDADGKLGKQELEKLGRHHGGGPPPMQRLWELDSDKSGGIGFEEFKAGNVFKKLPPEKMDEVFARLDTDGDKQLTPKDRPEPPFRNDGKRQRDPRQMLRQLDKNADGELSFEEFRAAPFLQGLGEDEQEDRFEDLDRNDDLKLTAEDFPPPPPADKPAAE